MYARRKSFDSSSSSDSSDSDSGHNRSGGVKVKKDKKDKKDKDKKDKKDKEKKDKKDKSDKSDKKDKVKVAAGAPTPGFPQPPVAQPSYGQPPPPTKAPAMSYGFDDPHASFPSHQSHHHQPQFSAPQPPAAHSAPPSGYRVPLSDETPFPSEAQTGYPPLYDGDGASPIFIGSALFENSVHPCKIGPHLRPHAQVAYGGKEHGHSGRYDLLPFVPDQMEWVQTSHGQIPHGRRPIEGGYEENGAKLYHGLAMVNGVRVPGKCGEHLRGCNVPFGGREIAIPEHEILCWRY